MTVSQLVAWLVIGLLAGWGAGQIMKGKGFGLIGNIIVGVLGAFVGGFLFRALGINTPANFIGSVIVALVGAVALLVVLNVLRRA